MADFTISPNMGLPVPNVGTDPGPDYASNVNNSLSLVDQHNHTAGNGVPITPSGMNISSDITFLNNNATTLRSVRFNPQSSALALPTDLGCLYENGVDLFYNDGNGNQIRLTQSGSIAGVSGSITGLVSPASVVFSALNGRYTFQANTNVAGKMDIGPITLRDTAASANGIDIVSPLGLAGNYTLTLLPALPGSNSFLTVDNSGNMGASTPVLGALNTNNLSPSAAILGTQLDTNPGFNGIASVFIAPGNFALAGAAGESNLFILRGVIGSTGIIQGGGGFSAASLGNGVYNITYSIVFTDVPSVVVTPRFAGGGNPFRLVNINSSSATGFQVQLNIVNSAGVGADAPFNFIAIGPLI